MSQPVKNALTPAALPVTPKIFKIPQLTSLIFEHIQDKNFPRVNKASNIGSQAIIKRSFRTLQQDLRTKAFQNEHPTLSSFIRSNQISNHQQLVNYLRKEAQVLGLTKTGAYQALNTSTALKDLLLLDTLIKQTYSDRANPDNRIWDVFRDLELPEARNHQTMMLRLYSKPKPDLNI